MSYDQLVSLHESRVERKQLLEQELLNLGISLGISVKTMRIIMDKASQVAQTQRSIDEIANILLGFQDEEDEETES